MTSRSIWVLPSVGADAVGRGAIALVGEHHDPFGRVHALRRPALRGEGVGEIGRDLGGIVRRAEAHRPAGLGRRVRLHDLGARIARHVLREVRRQLRQPDVIDRGGEARHGAAEGDAAADPARSGAGVSDFSPPQPSARHEPSAIEIPLPALPKRVETCRSPFALSSRWGRQHSSPRQRRARELRAAARLSAD